MAKVRAAMGPNPSEKESFLKDYISKDTAVRPSMAPTNRRWKTFTTKIWPVLKEPLPYVVLVLYTIFGGLIFHIIEGADNNLERNVEIQKQMRVKNETINHIANYMFANLTTDQLINFLDQSLHDFALQMGLQPQDVKEWSFLGSMFFSCTVYTTIGYGNMTPVTDLGRAITIAYALGGIPLVLFCLSNLGNTFCIAIWKIYTLCTIRLGRKFKCCEVKPASVGEFPFTLAICITVGWMLLGSLLFYSWEKWSFWESVYFFFQSLTTIGFGDLTPLRIPLMLASFALIFIGLALVSMCLNLVQLKLEHMAADMAEKIKQKMVKEETVEEATVEDAEKEVRRMAAENWLGPLLGSSRTNALIREWQRKAQFINCGVQATTMKEHKDVQAVNEYSTKQTQTTATSLQPAPFRPGVPYIERKRTSSESGGDEVKIKLRDLFVILDDCREMLHHPK